MSRILPIARLVAAAVLVASPSVALSASRSWAFLDKPKVVDELNSLVETQRSTSAAALEFVFDDRRYPVPESAHTGFVLGRDVQPGQAEMENLAALAIVAHNRLVQKLGALTKSKPITYGAKKPTLAPPKRPGPIEEYGISWPDVLLDAWFDALVVDSDPADADDRIGAGLRDVANGEEPRTREESAIEGLLRRLVRAQRILRLNDSDSAGHDPNECAGIRMLNLYRIALGLEPLRAIPKLRAMARDFAEEQARLHFFGHFHPSDPSRETPPVRARRVGYRASLSENCIDRAEGPLAVWGWRADAGHHRGLLQSWAKAVGLGCVETSVLNTGATIDDGLPP